MKIIRAMQDQNADVFTKKGAYDGKANFYGPIRYSFGEAGQASYSRLFSEGPGPNRYSQFPANHRGRTFQVRLKFARPINPQ